jgi:hypothetical protein
MTTNARRVVLVAVAAVLVGAAGWVLLVLGPRLAIPDETGRAVGVAPVVVTPAPTAPALDPAADPATTPAPTPAPAPTAAPTDSGGATVVPGPEPVEVGDDNGGNRGGGGGDDSGGSGRDHAEDG